MESCTETTFILLKMGQPNVDINKWCIKGKKLYTQAQIVCSKVLNDYVPDFVLCYAHTNLFVL